MNEVRGDFKTDATVSEVCNEFQHQCLTSIQKITELTDEVRQNTCARLQADAKIPSRLIGDMIRQAECLGATEKQVDDALDQSEMRRALIALIKSLQDWPCDCVKELATAPSDALEEAGPKIILMIGATGDGKSTLVNHLKVDSEIEARVSMEVKGTTKTVKAYRGRNNTIIIDTPGVGDYDVSVLQLYMLLEEALSQKDIRIDYVVVTTPLNNVKFNLSLQIVQLLVKKGFNKNGGHEWNHIILCGTKKDRAEPEELESFQLLADIFYDAAANKTGSRVMVDQNDVSELEKAIRMKPTKGIEFQAVGEEELAVELSAKLGFKSNDEFLGVLGKEREAMAKECQAVQALLKRIDEMAA